MLPFPPTLLYMSQFKVCSTDLPEILYFDRIGVQTSSAMVTKALDRQLGEYLSCINCTNIQLGLRPSLVF